LTHDQTDILAAMRLAGAHVITRAEAQSMSDWFDAHEAERDALPWALRGGDACRAWVKGLLSKDDAVSLLGKIKNELEQVGRKAERATARPLPQGTALVPILRKMFAAQRHAVLAMLQSKSLQDIEEEWGSAQKLPDDKLIDAMMPECFWDHLRIHAYRRALTARAKADPDKAKLPQSFIPLDEWTPELAKEVKPVIEIIARAEGRALLTRVGASPDVFSVFEKNIPQAAENLSLKFAESTNATTSMQLDEALSKLRDEISSGLTEGDTRVELTKRVEEVFDQAESGRAETIARTEGSRAAHEGELMSAKESGVVRQKYLILSADACPICEAVAAEGPKDLDEPFRVDGDGPYAVAQTPPIHINCQCSEGFLTTDAPEEKAMETHDETTESVAGTAEARHDDNASADGLCASADTSAATERVAGSNEGDVAAHLSDVGDVGASDQRSERAAASDVAGADATTDGDPVRPVPQDAPGAGAVLPDVRGGAADPGVKP
jgi:hypothetical protein